MMCVFYRGLLRATRALVAMNVQSWNALFVDDFPNAHDDDALPVTAALVVSHVGQERSRCRTGQDGKKTCSNISRQAVSLCLSLGNAKAIRLSPICMSASVFSVVFVVFRMGEGGKERRGREGRRRKERQNPVEMFSFFQFRNKAAV